MVQQRFSGEIDEHLFELEDWFLDRLREFPVGYRKSILGDIVLAIDHLPIDNGWSQRIGGVVRNPKPVFYTIEYLKQDGEPLLLLDISEIDSDEYLDLILETNTIESYVKTAVL
jgi:hypothetical protein